MTTNSINVIATCTNHWGDEIRILDINGTLYREEDGERKPMRFDVHDAGGAGADGDILSHANVKLCGWEVGEDHTRNFCSTVCWPSECFNSDIEQEDDLDEESIQAIKEWAADDLEEADRLAKENLKPYEAEGIVDDFDEWLDEQRKDYDFKKWYDGSCPKKWSAKSMIQDYLDDVGRYDRGYIINFHDEREVRKLLAERIRKVREFYPFIGVNYEAK